MQMRQDPGQMKHGTTYCYKRNKCRCEPCCDAIRVYQRDLARARHGFVQRVQYETYAPYLLKHIEKGVLARTIGRAMGVSTNVVGGMLKQKREITSRTFERLKSVPDDLPVGRMTAERMAEFAAITQPQDPRSFLDANDPRVIERVRSQRFRDIFRYLYAGGFTDETLAERLGITVKQLDYFRLEKFKDNRIGMRICQLHHLVRVGE